MMALLEERPAWLWAVADRSQLGIDEARRRLILAAALHDLGKFADNFQQKAPAVRERLQPDAPSAASGRGHGDIGAEFWDVWPDASKPHAISSWVKAAFAHHGAPVANTNGALADAASDTSVKDAVAFGEAAVDLIGRPNEDRASRGEWLVAGLVILADWIGSNQYRFKYAEPTLPLAEYWACSQSRARMSITDARLAEASAATAFGLASLLDEGSTASPLQEWSENQAPNKAPQLYILEDMTGAGKTEAALILCHRLMRAGAAEGLYWALPTMATANGLYGRLESRYRALFAPEGPDPSFVLAHGARDIHDGFQASIGRERDAAYDPHPTGAEDISAEAACAAFVAEDRKKTFLAQVGVGTIDQALLSILPVRHQSLRLAALCRRVLVIDEAHAYDPYMTLAMERLLSFHAAHGGSAIVLSATLTQTQRQKLAATYNGLASERLVSDAYPLVTHVTADTVVEIHQSSAPKTRRDVPFVRFETPDAVMNALLEQAVGGACGVYVRNTVKDAVAAFQRLKAAAPAGVEVELFHARYAIGDRKAREIEALARFGKASTPEDRRGRILVATQVVEQSLDLDFDYMATDLCPMDLLIQRAGRLQRHKDRPRRPGPVLWVVGPEAETDASADWFAKPFPDGQYVYPDAGQLWRTMRVLTDHGGLPLATRSPRDLIEPVFGEDGIAYPPALDAASAKADAKRQAERAMAYLNVLRIKDFSRQGGAWDSDIRTPTRLGEETVTVRLARWANDLLTPWAEAADDDRAWRLSEISVPARWLMETLAPSERAEKAIREVQTTWPDRYEPPMVLALTPTGDAEMWAAAWNDKKGARVHVTYSRSVGLAVG
jgi:CRISPR-associated endonuclease/helicase Cas3